MVLKGFGAPGRSPDVPGSEIDAFHDFHERTAHDRTPEQVAAQSAADEAAAVP